MPVILRGTHGDTHALTLAAIENMHRLEMTPIDEARAIKTMISDGVEGIRGRVRFVQHVTAPSGAEWLDVITIRTGHARSIRPAAVRRVHRRRA